MGSVGVVVDTTVEDGGGIFTDTRTDEGLSTWVLFDECSYVMDNTSNSDECLTILGARYIIFPIHDWKLLEWNTPIKSLSLLVEFLLQLLETSLFDFVVLELLEIISEAELLPDPDRPLCRVILMPFDSIAVIRGEFVVEVVVTLSECDESCDNVITRRVAVIEWLITEPMCQRVDTEGSLLNDENSENSRVDESSPPISPSEAGNQRRENHAHEDNALDVVSVLPDNDGIIVEVGDVGTADSLWVLLQQHPSEVRVDETLANGVWVLVGIGVTVVSSVIS